MKNKLFLILVLWAALTFCECVVAYQEQSEPPQLCTKKALKDLRKEEFKIKIEKDMGGLKSLSKDEKKEWKEYWKDRRNGLKSLKKNSKNSYWEERKARRRNNLVKAPAFEGKKEKSPHGLWKKESKPVRRKFEDYGPDERKAAHRRMKQSKKEWVSVHRQGLLETQSVGYASASEDPNHIEPTDPNYVEPTDPNYVEPTDPNYIEPIDPNYIEPIDPNYIEPGEIIEVYDDITENQRWTRNNLYWVHNSIDISAWLYIEPGTFVYYGYGAGLHPTEGGLLTSAGIPEMPIYHIADFVFMRFGYWNGIYIDETASRYCELSYNVIDSAYTAILLENQDLVNSIYGNFIQGNLWGIVEFGTKHTDISDNAIYFNDISGIEVFMPGIDSAYLHIDDPIIFRIQISLI